MCEIIHVGVQGPEQEHLLQCHQKLIKSLNAGIVVYLLQEIVPFLILFIADNMGLLYEHSAGYHLLHSNINYTLVSTYMSIQYERPGLETTVYLRNHLRELDGDKFITVLLFTALSVKGEAAMQIMKAYCRDFDLVFMMPQ